MAKNETYLLKPGQEHHGFKGEGNERVRHLYVGDDPNNNKVELSELQFNQLKDKFITEASAKELKAKTDELTKLQAERKVLEAALAKSGMSMEDLLAQAAETVKKPDSVLATENEPTPATNTPAPTGSTSDPVNAPASKNPASDGADAPKPAPSTAKPK